MWVDMKNVAPSVFVILLLTACSSTQESRDQHFENDYLSSYAPTLHDPGISYEQLGTLYTQRAVLIATRDDSCNRAIIRGTFLHIDMQAYSCNTTCRTYRVSNIYERATVLPYHSIFRGMDFERLNSSPFINAELYLIVDCDTLSIPFWKIDAIVPID